MTSSNRSDAKFLTHCADCEREIGCVPDTYNISRGMDSRGRAKQWRASIHRRPGTTVRCIGSRIIIPVEGVYTRGEAV